MLEQTLQQQKMVVESAYQNKLMEIEQAAMALQAQAAQQKLQKEMYEKLAHIQQPGAAPPQGFSGLAGAGGILQMNPLSPLTQLAQGTNIGDFGGGPISLNSGPPGGAMGSMMPGPSSAPPAMPG